jgi:hypothetical protein
MHYTTHHYDFVHYTQVYMFAKIKVQNVLTETRNDHWKVLQKDNGEAFVLDKLRIKGTFAENLELLLFPFDIQVFSYFHKK